MDTEGGKVVSHLLAAMLRKFLCCKAPEVSLADKAQQRSGMALDYDTFYLIMVILRRWTRGNMLSLMQTCSTLYQLGIPLLIDGPVRIGDSCPDPVMHFLLREPDRLRYLRDIHIVPFRPAFFNPLAVDMWRMQFTEVLSGARHSLKRLHIESLHVDYHRALLTTAGMLTAVVELVVDGVDTRIETVLMKMSAPVGSVSLSHHAGSSSPIPILQRFSDTLTTVTLNCPVFPHRDAQFPKVHTLHLRTSCYFENDAESLFICFPNVANLSMHAVAAPSISSVYEVHRQNTESGHRGWANLDTLSCSTQYYYAAGLNCRASKWVDANLDSRTITYFHDVLRRVQPSFLRLNFIPRRSTSELLAESYRIERLTTLDISVEVWLYQHGVQHFLDCLAASVNSLGPVIFLRLRVVYCQAPYALQKLFDQVAPKDLSHTLAQYIPNLRFLSLCLSRNLPDERGKDMWSNWQVTRAAAQASFVRPLSREKGKEMERKIGFQ